MKILATILLSVLFVLPTHSFADVNVGVKTLKFEDEQRQAWDGNGNRPILLHLFYPTRENRVQPLLLGPPGKEMFHAGEVVWDGTFMDTDKHPLILMSHGTGAAAPQMLWLAQALVKQGYIVAGFNHHGNTAVEQHMCGQGFVLWWERTMDLRVALDKLLQDNEWGRRIDQDRIGAAGFSLGGYTVISALGGITDKSLFFAFCRSDKRDSTCDPQPELQQAIREYEKAIRTPPVQASLKREHASFLMKDVRAGLVIAPAVVQSFTEQSLTGIQVPVSIIVGTDDHSAPAATNARRLAKLIPGNTCRELPDVNHYSFLSECTELGKKERVGLCADPPSVDRKEIHTTVAREAVAFFNKELEYDGLAQLN